MFVVLSKGIKDAYNIVLLTHKSSNYLDLEIKDAYDIVEFKNYLRMLSYLDFQ